MSTLAELAERGRQLAGQPQNLTSPADWFRIANAHGERAELQLFGAIGDHLNGAAEFTSALRGITASAIDLHINSPGGAVWDAISIYEGLKNHPAQVHVSIDGIAASAASFIAMSGDTIQIARAARMMIHDARGAVVGDAGDMAAMAELLNSMSDSIAEIYAERAGGDAPAWRDRMRAETWFTAHEAVQAKLADRVRSVDARNESFPASARADQLIRARARIALGRSA